VIVTEDGDPSVARSPSPKSTIIAIAAALAQLVRAHMEIERSKHFSIAWMMPVQFLLRGRLAR